MNRWLYILVIVLVATLAIAPSAMSALGGSGNVEDIVQLSTTTSSVSALASTAVGSSASGSPVASATAFTMTNSGSNLDTFIRYAWGTTPYYGASSSATSITIRNTATQVADLLFFKQRTTTGGGTDDTSQFFSPLLLKDGVGAVTVTTTGTACTGWSGTAAGSFSAASSGTIVMKYYDAANLVNDAPSTETFTWCADSTNDEIYIGKTASFSTATRLYPYTTNSASGVLKTYQYEALPGSFTDGNFYCLTAVAGSGTSAKPELAQCQKLPFDLSGSTTVKLFPLWDPPAYFPSVNQGGGVTYEIAGTQWNPYDSSETQTA